MSRRMAQVAWVLGYLDDIASDMSAIHRVDDIYSMPGPRFFTFAERLAAYQGVMQARLRAEASAEEPAPREPAPPYRGAPAAPVAEVKPVTREVARADPALSGIFSFGTMNGPG